MTSYRKPYSLEFRQQMVELVHAGRQPAELSKEFGCHLTSIQGWVSRAASAGQSTAPVLSDNEREELLRLRKQLKQIQQERDILAKATAWFAHNGVTRSE